MSASQKSPNDFAEELENRRLETMAASQLGSSGYSILKKVTCTVSSGTAILTGKVDGYFLKQLAQTTIQKIPGIRRIENRLVVRRPVVAVT